MPQYAEKLVAITTSFPINQRTPAADQDALSIKHSQQAGKQRQATGAVQIGEFSKIPNKFFGSGKAAEIGPTASLLFLALCEVANRYQAMSFSISDRSLAADTGLAPRTICEARKRLREKKLIQCSREKGRSFTYSLAEYKLPWIAVKDRPSTKRRARAMRGTRAIASAKFAELETWDTGKVC
jgi:DNA-binding transcriptional ArsR family regulator